jgi:hypothetical protein
MTDYSPTEVSTIAVYYDLSGFTSTMNDSQFTSFAATYLQRVNAFVAEEIGGRITEGGGEPTLKLLGDGGLYLFEAHREGMALLLEHLAERSARVIQRFPEKTQAIADGLSQNIEHVPRDIRIAITVGPCYKYPFQSPAARAVLTDYVGPSLNLGGRLINAIKGGQAVAWLGGMPAVNLSSFRYKKRDLTGRVRDFPDVGDVWWYNRQPSTQPIALRRGWAAQLARGIHLSKTHVEYEVRHFQAPENYDDLRDALFEEGQLIILHGIPGVGKTTTALRLLADCQEHGLVPRMPRVGRKTWKVLKDRPEDEVIWLDDPFGKNQATAERLEGAAAGLLDFCNEGKARVIITTRTGVFNEASTSFSKKLLGTLCDRPLTEQHYAGLDNLVTRLVAEPAADPDAEPAALEPADVNGLLEAIAQLDLRLPLDAVDLAAKIRGSRTVEEARTSLSQFTESLSRGGPKERYLAELRGMSRERDLMFMFLARSLANGVMNPDELETVFGCLIESGQVEGDRAKYVKGAWEECGKNWDRQGWWKWHSTGVCAMRHQLREEALAEFFAKDDTGKEVIHLAFGRLSRERAREALEAIAIALPQLGSRLPDQGRLVLQALMDAEDERALVRLAESIGRHFTNAESGAVDESGGFHDVLATALRKLLGRTEKRVLGAAAAAVCDNYGRWVDEDMKAAVARIALKDDGFAAAHVAWAIVSNLAKVDHDLGYLLSKFTGPEEGRAWVRLRAVEAIADYHEELDKAMGDSRFQEEVQLRHWATDPKPGPIVQRGIVGAIEANFEELPDAGELLLGLGGRGESSELLEWVVWAWGERFKKLTKDPTSSKKLLNRLTRLATHEDLRVRKWVAEALYNNVDPDKEEFVELLAKLAEDDSDHVRNAAAGFFGEEEDED